jgi:hypothetical protein
MLKGKIRKIWRKLDFSREHRIPSEVLPNPCVARSSPIVKKKTIKSQCIGYGQGDPRDLSSAREHHEGSTGEASTNPNLLRRIEMTKWISFGVVLSLLFFFSACNKSGPTTPGLIEAKTISVISARKTYCVGQTDTFTATVKMPDGSTIWITDGTWSSDTQNIATVDNAGLVTIVGEGWANITCAYGGKTGSKQIRGVGDYHGTWKGTYSIDGCNSSSDFSAAGFCDSHKGSGCPIDLVLTQDGDVLQGTIDLGSLSTTVVASLELDGSLTLEGQINSDPYVIDIAIPCQWTESGQIFGPMIQAYTARGMTGSARLICNITSLKRTGGKAEAGVIAGKESVKIGTL